MSNDIAAAIREAKLAGYWVRANGSVYSVTWPKRYEPHFRSDDLDVIRAWLRTRIEERYNRIRDKWAAAHYMSARPFPSSQTHSPRRLEKELIERLGFPSRLAQIAAASVNDQKP